MLAGCCLPSEARIQGFRALSAVTSCTGIRGRAPPSLKAYKLLVDQNCTPSW